MVAASAPRASGLMMPRRPPGGGVNDRIGRPTPRRTVGRRDASSSPARPEGRKLLRLEVRNAETPIERKPEWIKTRAKMGPEYKQLQSLVKSEGLHTVCQEAGCPNIFECWEDREATFLIGGDQCTRRCDFCQIDTGKPQPLDRDEPRRVAESVQKMELRYATITGVARDDLAGRRRLAVRRDRARHPRAQPRHRRREPDPRLQRQARPARARSSSPGPRCWPTTSRPCRGSSSGSVRRSATSARSTCITQARDFGLVTKSNLILGMGETREEVSQALRDLHEAGCELITITQYLRPSARHHPVERWVKPEEFVELKDEAEEIGFSGVMSGPAGAFVVPGRPVVPSGHGRPRGTPPPDLAHRPAHVTKKAADRAWPRPPRPRTPRR